MNRAKFDAQIHGVGFEGQEETENKEPLKIDSKQEELIKSHLETRRQEKLREARVNNAE